MFKIFTLIIFAFCFLNANNHKKIEASYDISYGIFGKLGIANASIDIQDGKYSIKVVAKATGMAKVLSSGKEETYTSTGIIDGNTFIPKVYTKSSKNNYKNYTKTYTFDYDKNKVIVERVSNRLVTTIDDFNNEDEFGFPIKKEEKWEKEQSIQNLEYFAPNDLLSLFFNIKQIIPNFDKGKNYALKAVGGNKTDGAINILIPNGDNYKELEKDLDIKSSEKFIAQINQKIFSSQKGELFISLNEHGVCNKAVLKDVVMFGDIVGLMTDFKIKDI